MVLSGDKKSNIDITLNVNSKAMERFLASFGSKATKRMYRRGLTLFCEWYKKDVDTILKERQDDLTPRPKENIIDSKNRASRYERLLENYHKWLLSKGYAINSARTFTLGLLQLFRYYNMPVVLRSASPVSQTVISTGDFILMAEHVRAMFHVAKDLRSKLIVSMAKDLGWRISDLLSIRRDELPNLEQSPPIEWLRLTAKEKKISKSCLSAETVMLLKEYLFSFTTKNPYLFNSNGNGAIQPETVNLRIRDLARDADIQVGNAKLTFHCFRKMIISQAKNLGIDPDIIKLMVGKAVKKDMLTYMTGIDVKTAFNKLQTVLGINIVTRPNTETESELKQQIAQLSNAILSLQKDLANMEIREQVSTKRINKLDEALKTSIALSKSILKTFKPKYVPQAKKLMTLKQMAKQLEDETQT